MEDIINFGQGDAFAAYSLPSEQDHYLVFAKDRLFLSIDTLDESLFVMAPFVAKNRKLKAIRPEIVMTNGVFSFHSNEICNDISTHKCQYLTDVQHIIEEIQKGAYQKLVYSKIKIAEHSNDNLFDLFIQLKNRHPKAFVFIYHLPGIGCWMGATPETLIKKEEDNWHSMALAGTQSDTGIDLNKVVWKNKEQEEQAFIEQFIKDKLTQEKINYQHKGPFTVRAANVLHLCTTFKIQEDWGLLNMAQLLHPGPAISGTPQTTSIAQIAKIEKHNREEYCGYLGPVNINGSTALFINLRSMRVFDRHLKLFVGGGITKDSVPENEWQETEDKSKTLLSAIEKSYI